MDIRNLRNNLVVSLGTAPKTGIVLGNIIGSISFFISHEDTQYFTPGFYTYDLFVYNQENQRVKLAYGSVEVVKAVTLL